MRAHTLNERQHSKAVNTCSKIMQTMSDVIAISVCRPFSAYLRGPNNAFVDEFFPNLEDFATQKIPIVLGTC